MTDLMEEEISRTLCVVSFLSGVLGEYSALTKTFISWSGTNGNDFDYCLFYKPDINYIEINQEFISDNNALYAIIGYCDYHDIELIGVQ
jgi:hypothetical protein